MRRQLARVAPDICTAARLLHCSSPCSARRKHDDNASGAFAYLYTPEVDLFWHDVAASTPTAPAVQGGPQPARRLLASLQAIVDVHNERLRADWASFAERSDAALRTLQARFRRFSLHD